LAIIGYVFAMGPIDREILEAVAEGRMTPDEAAARLEQQQWEQSGPDGAPDGAPNGGPDDAPPEPGAPPADGADERPRSEPRAARVRISAAARTVRVIGDPSISEAEAEGPHRVWRDDDELVISGSEDLSAGFRFRSRHRNHRDWRDWSDLAEWRRITEPLVVRVNPDLALTVDVSAGALSVLGVNGPLKADVAAGSARLEAVSGPLDVTARAGSVRIQGRLTAGSSRIRCDAGSVNVRLDRGSSVRVRAHVDLGRVRFHGQGHGYGHGSGLGAGPGGLAGATEDVVIGGGAGLLEIEAAMASVDITADDPIAAAPASR
jgi:hypothetical protein